ncbi:MAG: glycosyltransferase family 2 protein [Clostridia bacterium]|jgi:glycosyltransferase involved in cell wall biosynthesis|nr:glycosyltransferase family 2 protein [Clostridia bacterium]
MGVDSSYVSIIIPTYNRAELLEFTLLSLYKQSFSKKNFEVVVIDDCSRDETLNVIKLLDPPFKLTVLQNKTNRGAAYSRNQGIKFAKGEIIIFLDEMLVDKDFIKGHLRYHEKENIVVTTAFSGQFIYSYSYPIFSKQQKKECRRNTKKMGGYKNKTSKKGVVRLFSPKEVIDHSALKFGLRDSHLLESYRTLQKLYGPYLEEMAAPWFLFVTNGISISRELLRKAGFFDKNFNGAWLEDWELGYRLYKAGATFYNADDIACYHQTHPVTNRGVRMENYLYFAKKHPAIEVLLLAALTTKPFSWSFVRWGKIVTQFKTLKELNSETHQEFILAFQNLAQVLRWYVAELVNDRALPLLTFSEKGFNRWDPAFKNDVIKQLQGLEKDPLLSVKYGDLIKSFKDLLCLPIQNS